MIDKRVASAAEAVSDVFDGATLLFSGFGEAGSPIELIHALIDQGASLTANDYETRFGLSAGPARPPRDGTPAAPGCGRSLPHNGPSEARIVVNSLRDLCFPTRGASWLP